MRDEEEEKHRTEGTRKNRKVKGKRDGEVQRDLDMDERCKDEEGEGEEERNQEEEAKL